MSIFSRFALRSLARNRTRTAVSVAGVALACALITAVLTSVVSLSSLLVARTAADEGWWYAEVANADADVLDTVRADERVRSWTAVSNLGTVSLGADNSDIFGSYLYAKTWPQDQDAAEPLVVAPEIVAGRAPAAPGEIVLPHYLQNATLAPCGLTAQDGGALALGSAVALDLGTRTVTNLDDGSTYTATSVNGSYVDESTQQESFAADLGALEATVVGFYRSYGASSTLALQGNSAYVYDDGALERVIADGSEATWASILLRTQDPADAEPIADEIVQSMDANAMGGSTVHTSLIRWMGVTPDSAVWNTLYQIAAILAVVVVIAGVSLVYNSFAISVAERTRQFGLLSSLGASRRQLRRSVLAEALIIGAAGIPLGLVLGLAGCAVVFALTGEGIAALVGAAGGAGAGVVVSPAALGIAATLGLVTLLLSAWIPAVRASRVSAVDAIRQTQDVRLDRRSRRTRRARRQGAGTDLAPRLGIIGRIFGVPGFIAHRNLTRSSSKGRVTVAALAVSVALLVTSGSIADVMTYASDTAVDGMEGQDLILYTDATGAGADQTLALADGRVDGPGMQDALARFAVRANDAVDAASNGYSTSYVAEMLLPASMVSPDIEGLEGSAARLEDGSWYGSAYVEFVDQETWERYIDELGLPRARFTDPAHPRAIAVNSYDTYADERYATWHPFRAAGTASSLRFADLDGRFVSDVVDGPSGSLEARYYDDEGNEHFLPLADAVERADEIEVGALADHAPNVVQTTATLQLILPASAIDLAETMGYLRATTSYDTGGDVQLASDTEDVLKEVAADFPELDIVYSNVAEAKAQSRLIAVTVNTFVFCFAAICGLIAVANVFNTLANALILRRREFAMLTSIGMGRGAFRRMIAYECASYAVRGLAIGLALALLASWGLYQSMMLSFSSYTFQLPWAQIALAAGVVLAVICASVAYALHRCRVGSTIEALRSDVL